MNDWTEKERDRFNRQKGRWMMPSKTKKDAIQSTCFVLFAYALFLVIIFCDTKSTVMYVSIFIGLFVLRTVLRDIWGEMTGYKFWTDPTEWKYPDVYESDQSKHCD